MKILITTDLFTVTTNGVVTSVKNLYEELDKRGHDVRILTLSEDIHSHKDGNVYYIRSLPFAVYPDVRMPIAFRHRLMKELIEWKPDIIHSQCEFFSFQFAEYIGKETSAPIVHTYHTLYEQYVNYVFPSRRIGRKIVRTFSRKRLEGVSRIIAPTKKVENTLHGYGIVNNMTIVPTGISLKQHQVRVPDEILKLKRRELKIDDDKVVMINLGRLGTEKNLGELIELFAKAKNLYENLVFMIVGDGPARKELEELSQRLGVSEHVIFTGMVDPKEVQNYYQMADVFVSASTSETQGLTYVEAAANGLPLLCREDLCLRDVLKEGENGFAYNNEEEFLAAIKIISQNEKWRRDAAEISREIAAAFDKTKFGAAIEKVYLSVIEKNK
ncbi:MAG: glycosyltransferase family 4 protein [Ruminococcaceae bacterium]|nr:glycosyltransferase family 4 protein [Oscillospiraceae bacterium]